MRPSRTAVPFVPALVSGALVLAGCGTDRAAEGTGGDGYPMTITDCGREVVLDSRPERVLTSGSSAATLMWAAGAAGKITTRSAEGGAPLGPAADALSDIPQISPEDDLTREVILGERPDLVISAGLNKTTPGDLATDGIASVVNAGFCDGDGSGENPDGDIDFDDVYADIALYGRIFGTSNHARKSIAKLRDRVAAVRERRGEYDAQTGAALLVDGRSISAYGRVSMSHTQLTSLGLRDAFDDLEPRVNEINVETLIERDPDVLVVMYDGQGVAARSPEQIREDLRALPGAREITAIRRDRIVALQAPYLLASPLSVDGLERMAEKFATTAKGGA